MNEEKNRRILVVDDNPVIHDDFRKILGVPSDDSALDLAEARMFGSAPSEATAEPPEVFSLDSAYQGQEAWEKVKAAVANHTPYALAFVDMRMPPGWDGVETISKIWAEDPEIQIVICTAYSDYSWEDTIRKLGHVDRLLILKKPFDTVEVYQLACALTQKWHLARQANLKLHELHTMVQAQTSSLQAEVLERRRSEEAMRQSQARYALAIHGANDGIWDWDFSNNTVFFSPRWKSMLGLSDHEVTNSPEEWFQRIHPDDLERVKSDFDRHLAGKSPQICSEFRMRHQNQLYRWMLLRGVAVFDHAGKPTRAAGSQTDISDRKIAETQLRHESLHDCLTGLANRTMLMDRISRCVQHSKRNRDLLFAVIFIDLDQFKLINDSLGHEAGDKLLMEVSARLCLITRDDDTVSRVEPHLLARLGGDEFVVLLETIRAPEDALRVGQRIQDVLAQPFSINGQEVLSSASIGIAISTGNYEQPENILRDADTALYDAKKRGRNNYQIFHSDMHTSAVQRLWMENELRRALEREEFRLVYQPIVSFDTGKLMEVEALLRWQHPQRGVISPMEFIPLAEDTGLIIPIGQWVLREACRQIQQWHEQVPELAELAVGVNVSCRQFARRNTFDAVKQTLQQTGLDAKYLILEITETAVMDNVALALTELQALRKLGVHFHLDDFGTGYSSLGYLHRMPIEALKIDRSFVAALGLDSMSTSIVQAIIALAHTLNMRVIAEGVETEEQRIRLRHLGCNYAQGYLFAKPLSPTDLVSYARQQVFTTAVHA